MVAKFLDLKNLSWQRRPFLLSNNRRKVWATVLFLSAIMHRKVIHVNFFVFSSCHIWRTAVCWDPDILLPWQRDERLLSVRDLCYVYRILGSPGGNHCKSVKRSNDINARRRVVSPSKAASLIRQTITQFRRDFVKSDVTMLVRWNCKFCRVFCDKWHSSPLRQKKNKQDSFVTI